MLDVGLNEDAAARQSTVGSVALRAPRRRVHPVLAAIGVTLLGQVLVAAGNVALYRLLAVRTGTDGFASYSLAKQAVNLLFPVVTVGLVGGLPRYLALRRETEGHPPRGAYLLAALGISGAVTASSVAVALLAPGATAQVLFGGEAGRSLVAGSAALLVGTATFYVAFGYFRGELHITTGNVLQVLGVGLLPPVLVLALPGASIATLVALMGLGLAVLSIGFIAKPIVQGVVAAHVPELREAGRRLLDYGGRRVPGEIAQLALFALVPVLAAHVAGLREVAFLGAALQVVNLLAVALNPLGVVLLPSVAQRWATDPRRTSRQIAQLAAMSVHVGLFASVQVFIFAGIAIEAWLGSNFAGAGPLVRVALIAVGPYVFYLSMRSSLDAVAVRSYNARSNIAGLATFIAVAAVLLATDAAEPAFSVAWAFAAGVTVQGGLTFVFVRRLFGVRIADYALVRVLPLAALTAAAAVAARSLIDGSGLELVLLAAVELVLTAVYLGGLAVSHVGWITFLRTRGLGRGDSG
jgi:O-antigen/teichoic acid export membrane protein